MDAATMQAGHDHAAYVAAVVNAAQAQLLAVAIQWDLTVLTTCLAVMMLRWVSRRR
jgi:hypothetical protein